MTNPTKVFCYYEPLPEWPDSPKMLELWQDSWRQNGWEPIVLGVADAALHRFHDAIVSSDWLKLTVNGLEYTWACYRRWMAYAMLKDPWVLHADLDVINFGFEPDDLDIDDVNAMHCLERDLVPCVLHGPPRVYDEIVRTFRNAAVMRWAGPCCVKDDLSEMNLFRDYWCNTDSVIEQNVVIDRGKPGWDQAPLVHYTHSVVPEPRSVTVVMDVLRGRGAELETLASPS